MFSKLELLKKNGYYPDTILDIGACHGYWTKRMKEIYKTPIYHLYEAIDYSILNNIKDDTTNVYNILLNDKITEVDWFQMKNSGDSMFREKTQHFKNCHIIKRSSIDLNTHIKENNLLKESKNILIKIDCQGAEIPILKGASDILDKTDFIILEIPLFGQYNEGVPSFSEHIHFMESIGFVTYDILDSHYFNNFNMQIDVLFISKTHKFNDLVNKLIG